MMKKNSQLVPVFFLVLLCLLVHGCRDQRKNGSDAADTKTVREFSIGIVPERNIFKQKERYEPLAEYLSAEMGLNVKLRTLVSYENIIESIHTKELDAAFLGSYGGALAIKRIGAQPVARPQYSDGTSTYYGMIFTRKDSGINTALAMKGKTFAFVDRATTAGWLLPLHYFKEHAIDDPSSFLGEMYFTGTHEDAIMDVVNGHADIGAAKNTVFYTLAEKDQRILNDLTLLATSPPVPENSLFVWGDIGQEIQTKLLEVLLAMHKDEEGQKALRVLNAVSFIETSAKDYQSVFDYAEKIGLDLSADGTGKSVSPGNN